jgi:hypothetical protein
MIKKRYLLFLVILGFGLWFRFTSLNDEKKKMNLEILALQSNLKNSIDKNLPHSKFPIFVPSPGKYCTQNTPFILHINENNHFNLLAETNVNEHGLYFVKNNFIILHLKAKDLYLKFVISKWNRLNSPTEFTHFNMVFSQKSCNG